MALQAVGGKYEGVWKNELKNGDIAYYINYRDEQGKPVKKKVGVNTKQSKFTIKDAYDRLIETKHKLATGETLTKESQRKNAQTLNDLFDQYIEWAKSNKKSWRDDQSYYNRHVRPALGSKRVKTLKALDFEKIKTQKLEEGKAPQTVTHILQVCRHCINFAIKHELVTNFINPLSGGRVKMPSVDNARLAFLSKGQAKQLLEILNESHNRNAYHLTVFCLFTGARFSEVATLTWRDINTNTGMIFFSKTKNGNERHISITEPIRTSLAELAQFKQSDNDLIIKAKAGAYKRMPKEFERAVEAVIEGNNMLPAQHKITAHSLRHTHASWLAMAGLDILHIKEQLGHKTLEMTMRYSHLIPNKRHEATQKIIEF